MSTESELEYTEEDLEATFNYISQQDETIALREQYGNLALGAPADAVFVAGLQMAFSALENMTHPLAKQTREAILSHTVSSYLRGQLEEVTEKETDNVTN